MAEQTLIIGDRQVSHPGRGLRIAGDRYYTGDYLSGAIVEAVDGLEPIRGRVLEPHVGGGSFLRALLGRLPVRLVVADIDRTAAGLRDEPFPARGGFVEGRFPGDFLELAESGTLGRFDWTIGNPPFRGFEDHLEAALRISDRVVFLLRLAVLCGQKRSRRIWAEAPLRHVWALGRRPSFTAGGTDQYDYGVFFFDRYHKGAPGLTPGWIWRD